MKLILCLWLTAVFLEIINLENLSLELKPIFVKIPRERQTMPVFAQP